MKQQNNNPNSQKNEESLNTPNEDKEKKMVLRLFDGRYNFESKLKIIISYLFLIMAFLLLVSALPRKEAIVIDFLGIIKLNVGTQLDFIRLLIGLVLGYIGYKGVKLLW